jgi:hypothetical protein
VFGIISTGLYTYFPQLVVQVSPDSLSFVQKSQVFAAENSFYDLIFMGLRPQGQFPIGLMAFLIMIFSSKTVAIFLYVWLSIFLMNIMAVYFCRVAEIRLLYIFIIYLMPSFIVAGLNVHKDVFFLSSFIAITTTILLPVLKRRENNNSYFAISVILGVLGVTLAWLIRPYSLFFILILSGTFVVVFLFFNKRHLAQKKFISHKTIQIIPAICVASISLVFLFHFDDSVASDSIYFESSKTEEHPWDTEGQIVCRLIDQSVIHRQVNTLFYFRQRIIELYDGYPLKGHVSVNSGICQKFFNVKRLLYESSLISYSIQLVESHDISLLAKTYGLLQIFFHNIVFLSLIIFCIKRFNIILLSQVLSLTVIFVVISFSIPHLWILLRMFMTFDIISYFLLIAQIPNSKRPFV